MNTPSTPIKNGKKPLSAKPKKMIHEEDLFGNAMSIPADVAAELEAQGLVGHWLNAKQLSENGGYHKRGWVPYKRKKTDSATMSTSEFKFGQDPDGLIRRGSNILGVKSKEDVAKHKEFLAQKASRYKNIQKEKASELRQLARDANLDMQIHEGFEENEE